MAIPAALAAVYPLGVTVSWPTSAIAENNPLSWGKPNAKAAAKAIWFRNMILPILKANGNPATGEPTGPNSIVDVKIRSDMHNRTNWSRKNRDVMGDLILVAPPVGSPVGTPGTPTTLESDRFWVGMHITVDLHTRAQLPVPACYWSCHIYVDSTINKALVARTQRRGGGAPLANIEFWPEIRGDNNDGPSWQSGRPLPVMPAALNGVTVTANDHGTHATEAIVASHAYFQVCNALWISGELNGTPRGVAPPGFRTYVQGMTEASALALAMTGSP